MAAYGTPPRDPHQIASPTEKNKQYTILYALYDDCRAMRRAENAALKSRTEEARGTKVELKKARSEVVTMTKGQKAKDEANKAGYWSGAAAIAVTMMYEAFKVVGFPGGRAWAEWGGHEAVYGAIVWTVTMGFGWAYRATNSS